MKPILYNGDQTVASNRLLNPDGTGLLQVAWQQSKPIIPDELNLSQQLANEQRRNLGGITTRPGFGTRDAFMVSGTPSSPNTMTITCPATWVTVNGETLRLADSAGAGIATALVDRPASGTAYNLVFVEMWYAEIGPIGASGVVTTLLPNGWADSGTDLNSDANAAALYLIKNPQVTAVSETTRRIGLRWRYRVVNTTTNPTSVLSGDSTLAGDGIYGTTPRGGAASPVGGYTYANQPYPYLTQYRAGDGTVAAAAALGCVDGYVYAIPVAYVTHVSTDTIGVITLGQVTDRRKASNPLAVIGTSGNNTTIAGDDVIFYKLDGVTETARVIGSAGVPYTVRSQRLQSTVATGTAPLVVASTTEVANLNAAQVGGRTPGNASGNVPISNGTLNTNLNAEKTGGYLAVDLTQAPGSQRNLADMIATIDSNGKLPAGILTLPSATTANNLLDDVDGTTLHPASDFWFRVEKVDNATHADTAGDADTANSASTAIKAFTLQDHLAPGGPAYNSTHFWRKAETVSFATDADTADLATVATTAVNIGQGATVARLNFPTDETVLVMRQGNYSPLGNVTSWATPQATSATWAQSDELARFVATPSRFKFDAGAGGFTIVQAKMYGSIFAAYNPADDIAGTYTYGLRIYSPADHTVGNFVWGHSQTLAGGTSFRLEDLGTPTFTVPTNGSADGMWLVRIIITRPGVNGFWCSNISMRLYAV